ncbi:MAG: DUF542 domain-containing protein [Planctomycetales bacterium]|nr:DUF542 domain-containing protein [Planctomycetales bacterium]
MSNLQPQKLNDGSSVGQWVAQHPETAEVFEMLNIEYCCHGDKSLEKVCWEHGLEVIRVHSLLQRTIAEIDDANLDQWLQAPLADLCDHIEQTHHAFLKDSLPTVTSLLAEVIELQSDDHPELLEVHDQFLRWRDEALEVMADEERSLFPSIRQMEREGQGASRDWRGIAKLIRRVGYEHQDISEALDKARDAAGNYVEPSNASPAYQRLLELMHRIETDVRHHVHKEEYILFPGVLELAKHSVN